MYDFAAIDTLTCHDIKEIAKKISDKKQLNTIYRLLPINYTICD